MEIQAVGSFNFNPTVSISLSKPFAALRALTEVRHILAIRDKVSPDLTT